MSVREARPSPMKEASGGAGSGRKPTMPSEIRITPSFNGGFTVNHHYDNSGAGESYQPPKAHVFTSHAALMSHLKTATGGGRGTAEETGEVDGAAPGGQQPSKGVHGAGAPGPKSAGAGMD